MPFTSKFLGLIAATAPRCFFLCARANLPSERGCPHDRPEPHILLFRRPLGTDPVAPPVLSRPLRPLVCCVPCTAHSTKKQIAPALGHRTVW